MLHDECHTCIPLMDEQGYEAQCRQPLAIKGESSSRIVRSSHQPKVCARNVASLLLEWQHMAGG